MLSAGRLVRLIFVIMPTARYNHILPWRSNLIKRLYKQNHSRGFLGLFCLRKRPRAGTA